MAKITQPNLPADLPEDWNNSQYVSADGTVAGLTPKHGYNYLMQQVNASQKAVNTLAQQAQADLTSVEKQVGTLEQSVDGLEKGGFNATATRTGTTVAITGPEGAKAVTFLAPSNWVAGDTYTYNSQTITLTDLNGKPVRNGWKQGAPVSLSISGSTAYFAAGASGDFLPLEGGTMTGPAVGAPGAIAIPQFRNVQYGTEALIPGVSPLPQGMLYITPEVAAGESGGKRTCRFVVGISTAGWTEADCDYLCDGTADDVEINAAIQALPEMGGEIVILDGIYSINASIAVNKDNVTMVGNGPSTILQRNWSGVTNENAVIVISSNYCSCTKIHIDGNRESFAESKGDNIYLSGDYANIRENLVENGAARGIVAEETTGCNICRNIVKGQKREGIATPTSVLILVADNLVYSNEYNGISLSGWDWNGDQQIVARNIVFQNTRNGIDIGRVASCIVSDNILFQNSQYGIAADYVYTSGTIMNNVFNSNGDAAIHLNQISNSVISNNAVRSQDIGIVATAGEANIISGNNIFCKMNSTETQYSIKIAGRRNLIIGNYTQRVPYIDEGTENEWVNNKY